jgi:hypothetical protein
MLLPTKYERLSQNIMVVGAKVISLLNRKKYSVEDLYQVLKREDQINLERFYDTLSFLWITDVINSDEFYIFLKNNNVSY